MAGSIKWQVYTSGKINVDGEGNATNQRYLVKADESNGEFFGLADATGSDLTLPILRVTGKRNQPVIPRRINATGVTAGGQTVSRSFIVGNIGNTFYQEGGTFLATVQITATNTEQVLFNITYASGEDYQFLNAVDTGLNDGDVS